MRTALTVFLFVVAALAPFVVAGWRRRRWGLPVRVWVDPDDPRPNDIAHYLAEIAQRLDAQPERMRLVFDGRNAQNKEISLDVTSARTLSVRVAGHRAKTVDLRARWIADHPVPLDLRRAVLYIEPVDANRFRVMSVPPFAPPAAVYVACSLVATLGLVFLVPELVAPALGLPLGAALENRLIRRGKHGMIFL